MADDDRIVVTRGNSRAELLAVLCFKVLLGCDEDIGRGIQLEVLARPLLDEVVRDDKHTLIAESEAFALLCRRTHGKGLACAYHVGKERVAAVHDSCHGVALVFPQGDLRVHSEKLDVATIELTGAEAIETLVIEPAKSLSSCRVFPDPLVKGAFDLLLLALRDGGLFLV